MPTILPTVLLTKELIMLARIRKAIVAGLGAGIGAVVAVESKAHWHVDSVTISQDLAALILAGLPVGWATWKAPNATALKPGGPVR